jgi:uncharacterized protein (TIGR02466 family)
MLELFSVPIHKRKLNLNLDEMVKYCLSIKRKTKSVNISNQGGWQSPPLQGDHLVLNSLFIEILKAAEQYRKIISYKYPLKLVNLWINVNGYKDYNVEHIHANSVLSGAFYLTSNNSDIVFINPSSKFINYEWGNNVIENYNEYNSPVWSIKPLENDLLLFPSWLSHRVEPNLSKKNRISISFNLAR